MSEVIKAVFGPVAPDGLAKDLRDIADKVDSGNVTSMVLGFIEDGEYKTLYASSLAEALTLSALLQHTTVHKFGGV